MIIKRNPEVCAAELDAEICIFDPVKAEYLNLNNTGTAIWNLLEQPAELDSIIKALIARYSVDPTTCRMETEAFINDGLKSGMLIEVKQK